MLNIFRRAYSHYENGARQIPIDILIALSNIYNLSVDFILRLARNRFRK
ncbi:MAG: helix-turn-helix transcriptional regulator [Erysipelotrichaceae bacterium]|nr:helix-turn-helix transcriptional regulator [Erysipelotrichaceae bacterium]